MFELFRRKRNKSDEGAVKRYTKEAEAYFRKVIDEEYKERSEETNLPRFSRKSTYLAPLKDKREPSIKYQERELSEPEKLRKIVKDFDENKKINLTFSERLVLFSQEKAMPYSEIYKAADLDRRHFSKIISDKNYSPSRDTALALALALRLNLTETKEFLSLAGFGLSHKNRRDIIIEYFIREKQYDLMLINETLFNLDEKTLGE